MSGRRGFPYWFLASLLFFGGLLGAVAATGGPGNWCSDPTYSFQTGPPIVVGLVTIGLGGLALPTVGWSRRGALAYSALVAVVSGLLAVPVLCFRPGY